MTKINQTKLPKKLKREYEEGPEARQNFEEAMKALFKASKMAKKGKD